MRGMSRLAHATQTALKDMDDRAGVLADDLEAAQADSAQIMSGFSTFIGDLKANNEQVRAVLAQLTNGAPVPNSDASAGSMGNGSPPSA